MLIQIFLNLFLGLLHLFLFPLRIQALPEGFATTFAAFVVMMADGIRFINNYIDVAYISSLFAFIVALNALHNAYRFGMWLIKKIPFVNIK